MSANMFGILGHQSTRHRLLRWVSEGRLPQTNLFYGPVGAGKSLVAREVAAALLCQKSDAAPCAVCDSCLRMEQGSHPDFFATGPSKKTVKGAASETLAETAGFGVNDSVRRESIDAIRKNMSRFPLHGKFQVAVIHEAHQMTESAANSLLKILEEPRPHQIFILVTSRLHQMLITIRSRSAKTYFPALRALDAQVLDLPVNVAELTECVLTPTTFANAVDLAKKLASNDVDVPLLFQIIRDRIASAVRSGSLHQAAALKALQQISDADFQLTRRIRKEFVLENLFM